MKFKLLQPLRRDGKRMKPPGEVELDTEKHADDIAHLTRSGVIAAPSAAADDEAAAKAAAKTKADADAKAKAASKTTKAKE